MKELDGHKKDVHVGTEIVSEKEAEYTFVGAGRRPHKGMKLYSLDIEKLEVYEVTILKKTTIGLDKVEKGTFKATINKDHPMVWAINKKSALKKFLKMKLKV